MALVARINRNGSELDSVLNRFFGADYLPANDGGVLAPYPVDVREDADHFYVDAELPGFKKEEVEITLENHLLTITAVKKQEVKPVPEGEAVKGAAYLLRERRYSRFQRSFTLPDTVNDESVNAKLEGGVLVITLNKRPESKPRKIVVS